MKTIHVSFDEALLDKFDRHPAVRARGRSLVLREAVADYLMRNDGEDVTRRYRAGYCDGTALNDELEGWAGEEYGRIDDG